MGKKKTRCVGKLSNIMYFYNRKFPEHGISEMKIIDMREVKSVITGKPLYVHSVLSYYDIDLYGNTKGYPRLYELGSPTACGKVYGWHNHFNNEIFMSFEKDRLMPFYKADVYAAYTVLKKRMEELEGCLNQK